MRGPGVYLWKKCRNWTILAKGWYLQARDWGRYRRDSDPQGAVIYAIARVPEDRYIDLNDQEAVDAIDELADQTHIDKADKNQISAVYARFISEVESKLGNSIDVYETEVAPPNSNFCPDYSTKLLGLPKCYCVRDPKVVFVSDTQEIDE
jgi:hypothetical protein